MEWTANLSYVIGLITTDGSLSSDGRHIVFTSKDLEQIQTFATILQLKNKIGQKKSTFNPTGRYHQIQFGDVKLYKFLQEIGLTPNKTMTLGELCIPDEYFADFLRGHLDGDGFTHSYWDKRWKNSFLLYTGFVCASEKHLIWIREKIKKLYLVDGRIKYNGKSTYHLVYAKQASIRLLKFLYYSEAIPSLSRKRFKINQALGIIDSHADVLKLVYRHA